jgi:hypothetical protein
MGSPEMKTSFVPGSQGARTGIAHPPGLDEGRPGGELGVIGDGHIGHPAGAQGAARRRRRLGGGDSVGGAAVGAGAAVSGGGDGAAGGVAVTTTVATGPQASAASNRTTAGPHQNEQAFLLGHLSPF